MTRKPGAGSATYSHRGILGSSRLLTAAYCWLAVTLMTLRIRLWPIHNTDQDLYFLRWHSFLIEHGRLLALKQPISDYFPSFFELTALTSLLDGHLSRIAQIKLLPFCFDVVAAGIAWMLVRALRANHITALHTRAPEIAAIFVILAGPTVILNGSAWGQTDIIYTTFLLLTVYLIAVGKGAWASLAYGFAFAFKLQSVFLAPFFVAMILRRRVPVASLLLLPVGWLLALAPPLFAGGSPLAFAKLPFIQSHELPILSVNCPNPWVIASYLHCPYHAGVLAGLALTALAGLVIVALGLREGTVTPRGACALAAACLLTMPYVMPKMHDRYFFSAEVLLSILACADFVFILPAMLVVSASLIAYASYFMTLENRRATMIGLLATSIALLIVFERTIQLTRKSMVVAGVVDDPAPPPAVARASP